DLRASLSMDGGLITCGEVGTSSRSRSRGMQAKMICVIGETADSFFISRQNHGRPRPETEEPCTLAFAVTAARGSERLPLQVEAGRTKDQTPHYSDGRAPGELVPQLDRLLKVSSSDGENQQVGALVMDGVGLVSVALCHRYCKVERQT